MKEWLRDKYRDDLVYSLNSAGVKAEMAQRDRVEEKTESSWYQRSLGVIDISGGPIKWINILKTDGSKKIKELQMGLNFTQMCRMKRRSKLVCEVGAESAS